MTLERAMEVEPRLQEVIEKDSKVRQVFTVAKRLEGLYRHAASMRPVS